MFPVQIFDSFLAAGCTSQLMFARIDAARFAAVYSAKGQWGLLDQLLFTTAPAGISRASSLSGPSGPPHASSLLRPHNNQSNTVNHAKQAPTIDLPQVVDAVKKAAADVLGQELSGV